MPFAEVAGARIHYQLTGTGSPVALVLPQSTGPTGRDTLVRGVAATHRVLTFHQRGTGCSDPAPPGQDIASFADDLHGLLMALDLLPCHLVCHSTGCGVGISLAAAHPGSVSALVLTAPWTHGDPYLSAMQDLRKAAARDLDPRRYARFNAAVLFPPAFRRTHLDGFAAQEAAAVKQPVDAADLARRLDAIVAFDARPLWPRITCPARVMVAKDDQLMPDWFARETAAGIPGADLLEFDHGGHMLPETRTRAFLDAVLPFLATCDGVGAS